MDRFELNDSFFEDEIREGFYIPSAMKKAWGAELRVLNEIDRVCEKLGIRYFATWGTFLGAVRHQGFVPWDDDMDICMLRDDYIRFLNEGIPILPDGYTVYNLDSKGDHIKFVANVVAKPGICFEEEHLREFQGFPYIASVDLFQLDYIPNDEIEYELYRLKPMMALRLSDELRRGNVDQIELKEKIEQLEKTLKIKVPESDDFDEIRRFLDVTAEKLFAAYLCRKDEAKTIAQFMPCVVWDNHFYFMPAYYYSEQVELPFEMGTMPVPLYYLPAMRHHYKNYMMTIKGNAAHSYPFFEKMREEMQVLSDNMLPEYTVSADELIDRRTAICPDLCEKHESYKEILQECLSEMGKVLGKLDNVSNNESILEDCSALQQLSVDMGTFIESVKGEGYFIVKKLEEFCEAVYCLSEEFSSDNYGRVMDMFHNIEKTVMNRKEILFLPFNGVYWEGLSEEYDRWDNDPEADVYVVPIPYYYKDYLGRMNNMQYDLGKYPSDLKLIPYEEYDYAFRHPDVIYIQNPYDGWNEITSIPSEYFSDKLLQHTDKLIYIPWFKTYDFTRDDRPQYFNMRYYCCVPGVVNADEVILQSDLIRDVYIEKMCDFIGEETRILWEKKFLVKDKPSKMSADEKPGAKILLYYQDFSEILLFERKAIERLNEVAENYNELGDYQKMLILQSDLIEKYQKTKNNSLIKDYIKALSMLSMKGSIMIMSEKDISLPEIVEKCDGYYGDTGYIAHLFDVAGKKVLIQDYEKGV